MYLSDRSQENKMNVKKVEKALKYELRTCEMDKTAYDLEDMYGIIVKYCNDM